MTSAERSSDEEFERLQRSGRPLTGFVWAQARSKPWWAMPDKPQGLPPLGSALFLQVQTGASQPDQAASQTDSHTQPASQPDRQTA